jgi:Fatty acid hydroxylase superfamily
MLPAGVRTFREAYRAEHIGPRYSGWAHFATTTGGSLAVITFAIVQVDAPATGELACVPAFFLFANLVEYFFHRGPMHHRRPGLGVIFMRHTLQHHRFYTHEAMDAESPRDYQMVLFPPLMLALLLAVVGPIAALLAYVTTVNVGWLFLATGVGYFLSYEWLHWAYHQPVASFAGRLALVRWLRRHHTGHHDPARMTRANFNITFPIGDRLFGTADRSAP